MRIKQVSTFRLDHHLCLLHKLDLVWVQFGHVHHTQRSPVKRPQRRRSVADKVETGQDGLGSVEEALKDGDIGEFSWHGVHPGLEDRMPRQPFDVVEQDEGRKVHLPPGLGLGRGDQVLELFEDSCA